jgi:putative hemolysin
MQNAESLSMKVSGTSSLSGTLLQVPLVKLADCHQPTSFVKAAGGNPNAEEDEVTEEEIRMMIDVGEEKGAIDEIEKVFINNVFDFDDKVVSDIMTHRTRVVAISIDCSLDDIVELINEREIHKDSRLRGFN